MEVEGAIKSPASLLGALRQLLLALLLTGCASIWTHLYPRLKDTDVHVSWAMTTFRNEVIKGRVTLGEREQVHAAYAEYKTAFDAAVEAAHHDYTAATPENVQALANELLRILWAMPY